MAGHSECVQGERNTPLLFMGEQWNWKMSKHGEVAGLAASSM
jgi:hypothetical protein